MAQVEIQIVRALRNVYDTKIPVNIYDLGLVYEVNVEKDGLVKILMTLTSPACPMADDLIRDVYENVGMVTGVSKVDVKLTFDPPWNRDMMTDEAKLELGLL